MSMQAAIEAALIAAVATGTVAITSIIASGITTTRTLRANREVAGDARVWSKTSEIYETVLADVTHRQLVREHAMRGHRFDSETEARLQKQLDEYQKPDFVKYEARIRAYASDAVLEQFLAVHAAERAVTEADGAWETAAEIAKANPNSPEAKNLATYKPRLDAARKQADAAVIALGEVVRKELRESHLQRRRRWFRRAKR